MWELNQAGCSGNRNPRGPAPSAPSAQPEDAAEHKHVTETPAAAFISCTFHQLHRYQQTQHIVHIQAFILNFMLKYSLILYIKLQVND